MGKSFEFALTAVLLEELFYHYQSLHVRAIFDSIPPRLESRFVGIGLFIALIERSTAVWLNTGTRCNYSGRRFHSAKRLSLYRPDRDRYPPYFQVKGALLWVFAATIAAFPLGPPNFHRPSRRCRLVGAYYEVRGLDLHPELIVLFSCSDISDTIGTLTASHPRPICLTRTATAPCQAGFALTLSARSPAPPGHLNRHDLCRVFRRRRRGRTHRSDQRIHIAVLRPGSFLCPDLRNRPGSGHGSGSDHGRTLHDLAD